jgi:hypothetical protein
MVIAMAVAFVLTVFFNRLGKRATAEQPERVTA